MDSPSSSRTRDDQRNALFRPCQPFLDELYQAARVALPKQKPRHAQGKISRAPVILVMTSAAGVCAQQIRRLHANALPRRTAVGVRPDRRCRVTVADTGCPDLAFFASSTGRDLAHAALPVTYFSHLISIGLACAAC